MCEKTNLSIFITLTLFPLLLFAQNECLQEEAVFKSETNYFAIPNAFTPNGDGINDLLLTYNSPVSQKKIIVSSILEDEVLFESDEIDAAWDGLSNGGQKVKEGIYKIDMQYLFENGEVELGCRTLYLIRESCLPLNEDSLNFPIDFNAENITFNATSVSLAMCDSMATNILENPVKINLYPNPATKNIYISSSLENKNYQIINSTGAILQNGKLKNSGINISNLKNGLYYLKISASKQVQIARFLVQHK